MSRIVISEFMDERAVAQLRAVHDVRYDPHLVDDATGLAAQAHSADAIIVRNRTQVRGELLAALSQCRVVGRLGVGLDNIDVHACQARGMKVIPATGANALAVAEYVAATALLLLRGVFQSSAHVAQGLWPRNALSNGREVHGKTMGLIGFGSIGQHTACLAKGLGMQVLAHDNMIGSDHPSFEQLDVRCVGLDELISLSDVISLHIPLVASTKGLFDAKRIASMNPNAFLINTSRGEIVDEMALAIALKEGRLAGAALDVFDAEPLPASPHFLNCPNLILTPHVAGLTFESNERVSFLIAEKVLEALA